MRQWEGLYSTTQVARLARVPVATLRDWKRRGIVAPTVVVTQAGTQIDEGYSYADLTIIRLLRALRDDQVDLTSAGVALRHLFERLGPPSRGWAKAKVFFVGRRIYAEAHDEWGTTAAKQFGQLVDERLFGDLFDELRGLEEDGSILVPADWRHEITINPAIMGGEPVVRGTRVPTSAIFMLSRAGRTLKEIATSYPMLAVRQLKAAIAYEGYLERQHA